MIAKIKVPATIALAILITALVSGTVFAQRTATTPGTEVVVDYHGPHFLNPTTLQQVSQLLGISPEELTTRLQQGESLLDIAQSQGVSEEQLVATVLGPQEERLQAMVENGFLTAEQAEARLEWQREHVLEVIHVSWTGPVEPYAEGHHPYGWAHDPEDCPMHSGWGYGTGTYGPPDRSGYAPPAYGPTAGWGGPGYGGGMMGGGTMGGGYGGGMMGWGW
jgi:hypothetical protein